MNNEQDRSTSRQTPSADSDNYIIYGHNMKNGTMFREILQYADKADYDNAIQNDKEKSLYDTGVTAKGKSTFFISRR